MKKVQLYVDETIDKTVHDLISRLEQDSKGTVSGHEPGGEVHRRVNLRNPVSAAVIWTWLT